MQDRYCERCRCRPVRKIEDETGTRIADDDLCHECANRVAMSVLCQPDVLRLYVATREGTGELLRLIVATCLPTRRELRVAVGARATTAEFHVAEAAKSLITAAQFIATDDYTPPTRPPTRDKTWADKKAS